MNALVLPDPQSVTLARLPDTLSDAEIVRRGRKFRLLAECARESGDFEVEQRERLLALGQPVAEVIGLAAIGRELQQTCQRAYLAYEAERVRREQLHGDVGARLLRRVRKLLHRGRS